MKTVFKSCSLNEAITHIKEDRRAFMLVEIISETTVGELLDADGFMYLAPADPEEQKPQPKTQPKAKPKATAKKAATSNGVDHGKIMALHKAGWSTAAIADEIGCSGQTVLNHLAKENSDVAGKDSQP